MKSKKKIKTNSLVVKDNMSVNLSWGSVTSKDSQALQTFCLGVAKVYGVPPMGVNSLAGQPYLNKDGRLYLLNSIMTGKRSLKAIRTEFLQLSANSETPAICKKTLVFRDGLEIEGIGEASKENVKLDAVKKTLNMMAETRALNRAIWEAIAGDVWDRVANNLAKSNIKDPETINKVKKAGEVSYEEVVAPNKPQSKEMTTAEKFQKAKDMIKSLKTRKAIADVIKKIQESDIYDKEQKNKLIEELVVRDNEIEHGK